MKKYSRWLPEIVRKRISQGYDYLETLRSLYGADPREVWNTYKRHKNESARKIGVTNSYPEFPEPHPVYSQWRMTAKATRNVLEKILEKDYKKVCFLGCPILGVQYPNKSILLDIDKTALNYAKEFTQIINYDVNDKPPIRNRFECVVSDPPWYYDEIKLFIQRASQLTKNGGTIYISTPGLFTKHSIMSERLDLQKWMSNSNLIIAEIYPIVEYEVPAFEYMAYKDIPAFSGKTWRKGDWIKIKKLEDSNQKINPSKHKETWHEYNLNNKRIFLRDKKDDGQKPKLNSLYNNKSLILKTVSKRNILIPKIDLWSSRNGVLHIESGYNTVKTIMDNIKEKDERILEKIIKNHDNSYIKPTNQAIKKIRELISV